MAVCRFAFHRKWLGNRPWLRFTLAMCECSFFSLSFFSFFFGRIEHHCQTTAESPQLCPPLTGFHHMLNYDEHQKEICKDLFHSWYYALGLVFALSGLEEDCPKESHTLDQRLILLPQEQYFQWYEDSFCITLLLRQRQLLHLRKIALEVTMCHERRRNDGLVLM